MPPISVLIKPASGNCNMKCKYCFYTDETEKRKFPFRGMMSKETMERLIDRVMEFAEGVCSFAFQGGEPSLAGLSYFRAFTKYVSQHPRKQGLDIRYSFQTNGYDLDDEWMRWFAENQVLVGISLDGPEEIHNRYRVDHAGAGTFHRVMETIQRLNRYQIEYNILTVVTSAVAEHGEDVRHFFKEQDFSYQQYIECLDPLGEEAGNQEYSLKPKAYAAFLKQTFDEWYADMKSGNYIYNRYFENLMLIISGQMPESCNMRGVCGVQWVIEADGSVYPCDFYALDEWYLGNICTNTLEEMEEKRQKLGFIQWSRRIPDECKSCRYLALCRNGCRRNREPVTSETTCPNYFCAAYKEFLEYAYPKLTEICCMLLSVK